MGLFRDVSFFLVFLAQLGICVLVSPADVTQRRYQRQAANMNTRLGLISSLLNIPPVPIVNQGGRQDQILTQDRPSIPSGCHCIPPNQLCDPEFSLVDPNSAVDDLLVDLRVLDPSLTACHNEHTLCCLGNSYVQDFSSSALQPLSLPNPSGSKCGIPNPIINPSDTLTLGQAKLGEFPWMALIAGPNNEYYGGGALIADEWVLTAAHIVSGKREIHVRVGDYNIMQPQDHPEYAHVQADVQQVIIHPNYNKKKLQNNVALLHLSFPVVATISHPHIQPVCLPEQGQLFVSQRCVVSGWGKNAFEGGTYQDRLKKVEVPIVDHFRCEGQLKNTRLGNTFKLHQKSFLCAGGESNLDSCVGDGGSPLVCNSGTYYSVVGLVAWGIGCGTYDIPGVYVNVAQYVDFIRQHVRDV